MRPDQWERVKDLLDKASELPDERRRPFLEEECRDDPVVLEEALSLLGYQSDPFPDRQQLLNQLRESRSREKPDVIEGYRLGEELGAGGMGVVYLAEQQEPVRRTVAVKLIQAGLNSEQVIARFNAERQALAMMDHPAIAKVFDAGAASDGRPYFVMEHVEGAPIIEYCDQARLGVSDRLRLFGQVCAGVQHAHQKGIIHRDLKPSNILITEIDGRPVPKIIDFGIAKATDKRLFEATLLTARDQLVGTAAYMSPEQAKGTGQAIDTRTDVYSLGVVLYELLVGALPFEHGDRSVPIDEYLRDIREKDPALPSARIRKLRTSSPEIMERRLPDPAAYVRDLKGDLDWIVMRAMEKDPERRYPSASDLAEDIQRYLDHEPIEARPPSAGYRMTKFVRRHRFGVAAGVVLALSLVAGIIGTGVSLVRARAAEKEALIAQQAALAEARSFKEVSDYLVNMLKDADPQRGGRANITLKEILDRRAEGIEETLADEPRAKGRIMAAMGRGYSALHEFEKAEQLLESALPLLRQGYGERHEEVFSAINELGNLAARRREFERAISLYESALAMAGEIFGPDYWDLPVLLKNLADAHERLGEFENALPLLQRAKQIRESRGDENSNGHVQVLGSLSRVLSGLGKTEEAVSLAEAALDARREIEEPGAAGIGYSLYFLGEAQFRANLFADAADSFRKAVENWRQSLGPGHQNVGEAYLDMARCLTAEGQADAAHAALGTARTILEAALDRSQPSEASALAGFLDQFAELLAALGQPVEAARTRAEADALRNHPTRNLNAAPADDRASARTYPTGRPLAQFQAPDRRPHSHDRILCAGKPFDINHLDEWRNQLRDSSPIRA